MKRIKIKEVVGGRFFHTTGIVMYNKKMNVYN